MLKYSIYFYFGALIITIKLLTWEISFFTKKIQENQLFESDVYFGITLPGDQSMTCVTHTKKSNVTK